MTLTEGGWVYAALPEAVCQALRCSFVEQDFRNNCIIAHPFYGKPVSLDHGEAVDYLIAWRSSGLWSLPGRTSA